MLVFSGMKALSSPMRQDRMVVRVFTGILRIDGEAIYKFVFKPVKYFCLLRENFPMCDVQWFSFLIPS